MRAMAAFSRRRPSAARPASAPFTPPAGPGAERPAGTVPKGRGRKAERLPGREAARREDGATCILAGGHEHDRVVWLFWPACWFLSRWGVGN
jgi:hypothetical protein